jgi:DNA-binding transcriptional ArsR family regulator
LTTPPVRRNLPFVTTDALDVWALLGDPSRRSIIEALSSEPSSVTDLAKALPISRPAVSQHLKLLKDAGVVVDRAEGTRRIYSVDTDQLARYRAQLDRFWGATLNSFAQQTELRPGSAPH